jgi:hypothetical protein
MFADGTAKNFGLFLNIIFTGETFPASTLTDLQYTSSAKQGKSFSSFFLSGLGAPPPSHHVHEMCADFLADNI